VLPVGPIRPGVTIAAGVPPLNCCVAFDTVAFATDVGGVNGLRRWIGGI